jgi:hypothetical protein
VCSTGKISLHALASDTLSPSAYYCFLSSSHEISIDGEAVTYISERRPRLDDTIYETESEARLIVTSVTL